jgi:hypothetical protein
MSAYKWEDGRLVSVTWPCLEVIKEHAALDPFADSVGIVTWVLRRYGLKIPGLMRRDLEVYVRDGEPHDTPEILAAVEDKLTRPHRLSSSR